MVHSQQTVDRYGHSGYSVVIMAPKDVQDTIGNIRKQLEIPVPMIPAHVTVKGTFVAIPSVEEICGIIESIAQKTGPTVMELDKADVWGQEGSRGYAIRIKSSPELDEIHRKLFNAIDPVTTNVYGREAAEGFHFHMTVYQEVDEANHQKGLALAHGLEVPQSMEARSMCLMGRIGPRGPGGRWHVVREFAFSAA